MIECVRSRACERNLGAYDWLKDYFQEKVMFLLGYKEGKEVEKDVVSAGFQQTQRHGCYLLPIADGPTLKLGSQLFVFQYYSFIA